MNGGVYLYENGKIIPGTQAIRETDTQVTYLSFGKPTTKNYIPIDEACAKCKPYFGSVQRCQEEQKKDAEARGFTKLICPNQLIREEDGIFPKTKRDT